MRDVAVVRYRVEENRRRLTEVTLAPSDPVQVNAVAADYLDAVYSARDLVWKRHQEGYLALVEEHPSGEVVQGMAWARNSSTHRWLVTGSLEDIYDDRYTDLYGVWCWSVALAGQDPPHARHYTNHLGGRPVHWVFDPAEEFLFEVLPRAFPDAYPSS